MSAAVFKQPEDFKAAAQLAQAAADGGGVGALEAPFGSAAQSCNACHKAFRK